MSVTPRQELRHQLQLALPIFGGQLAQSANGFVDTVMAGRVSALDLAAVAVGASIWVPVFLFMTGMLMSATSVLARHVGGNQLERINPLMHQVIMVALVVGSLSVVVLCNTAPLLAWMDVDPTMRPMVVDYLFGLSWGMPAIAIVLALRSYTEAMSHTRPVLIISVVGLLANIPINYVLIYGKLGIPAMGGVGCGWATAIVMWIMAILMLLYVHRHRAYRQARLSLRPWHWEPKTTFYLVRLGLPVGLTIFFEVSVFCIIALLISQSGAEIVAGHQLALNFTSLVFMLPLSFALAATARVGHARGRKDEPGLRTAIAVAFKMTLVIGVLMVTLLVTGRHWIPLIYTDNVEVIALASYLLLFAALYQISDAIQVTANGCLRGFEDTTVPMLLTLFAYWGVGLPLGYVLATTNSLVTAMGPSGFWLGLFAGLSSAALLLAWRLRWRLRQPVH
ncbi:Multidrug resistance protein NorM [Zhongshania aliphaticivorans]|uniref:Multidrug-efflux transporter n=1 Tax=Zhongshania aliphaticivorans TaxID=1470434 RepID=A0A5S9N549_9GAMM|nr:MATE family efflux transporter [Zhongshania aliphaticivorans]CAA0082683.1 Multidrug resistance protein NorM [Zhongshania aliphaticivorans]CAA0084033.1 Multidrug resistance protein NorM [Zhongshania aliphaticivorans]